jgi:hypothetical protein
VKLLVGCGGVWCALYACGCALCARCAVCARGCAVCARWVNDWLVIGMGFCYFGVFRPRGGVVLGGVTGGRGCSGFEA